MTSLKDSSVGSAIKNLDLTLELEIPLPGPSDSSNSCPSISVGPVQIPLGTCQPRPTISGVFTRDQLDSATGNSLSPPMTGDQETSESG